MYTFQCIQLGTHIQTDMSLYVYVSVYVCMHVWKYVHMHSYQVTAPVSLYKYLTYVTKQLWLPHYKYNSQLLFSYGHIPPVFFHTYAKTQPTAYLLYPLLPCKCKQQICLSNGTYILHIQIRLCANENFMSVYMPNMSYCTATLVYI